jgi:hypothetical protein
VTPGFRPAAGATSAALFRIALFCRGHKNRLVQ